jgi:hypothetical protein
MCSKQRTVFFPIVIITKYVPSIERESTFYQLSSLF